MRRSCVNAPTNRYVILPVAQHAKRVTPRESAAYAYRTVSDTPNLNLGNRTMRRLFGQVRSEREENGLAVPDWIPGI